MISTKEDISLIIADLQLVLADSLLLRTIDYERGGGRFTVKTIYRKIGSWGNALVLAGLISTPPRAHQKQEKTPRMCLGCDRTFRSEGSHNRLCETCKENDSWKDGHAVTYRTVQWGYPD